MRDAVAALDADRQLEFIALASSLAAALARRDAELDLLEAMRDPSADSEQPRPDLPEYSDLISMFVESGQRPMQALAYLLARFCGNDLDRIRVGRGSAMRCRSCRDGWSPSTRQTWSAH